MFKESTNDQAYLKAGLMGFAGDGKTYTASEMAIGVVKLMRKRNIPTGEKPVYFIDTETGSNWVRPRFEQEGIKLLVAKSRALVDLKAAIKETEANGSVLIIDSITHFWDIFCDEYAQKKQYKKQLEFQDWAWLKKEWRKFTDLFINSKCHLIMCGRAGFEYDFVTNEKGKKDLVKSNIKMRAEGETGYEPSLLIQMEKHRDIETDRVWRTAFIIKDRSTHLDGKSFVNPTFEDFLPHINFLNLCGEHVGFDDSRTNSALFDDEEELSHLNLNRKDNALNEIKNILSKHYPQRAGKDAYTKGALLTEIFTTKDWSRITGLTADIICNARDKLYLKLEGKPYAFKQKQEKINENKNEGVQS